VAAFVVGICAALTWRQILFWRDTRTLFTRACAVTSRNWLAEYKLGVIALQDYEKVGRGQIEDQVAQGSPVEIREKEMEKRNSYLREIVRRCETALQWEPRIVDIHVTLAKALTEMGDLDRARGELEAAVKVDPNNADARENLAEILYRQGRVKDAVAQYKEALRLSPEWQSVLNNLAWILATDRDPQVRDGREAVRLAEQACNLTGNTNLWFLHSKAAAYAENGDFPRATATAISARELATATGNPELIKMAEIRFSLYTNSQPLRAP
jgi:cytochrome c-type biogenesis protein CcmH/NrfG